ncbi:hypothetical protein [Hymenobacter jejuensis]|uniref:Apea-like HEPN domain-containing protein n=1 Tax=Hymenobacter jejuensis TaxID=2502781 RepID=A0A5B7ZYZ2_9BACT|nr:hypothetical protein [Hymenobacter jejuensis]QDA60248.1 hypothetical protein FHG12_09040 [Hymenobacter jejuensis]
MQINFNKNFVLERLFIEFFQELCSNATLDSYRAKSASPKSILAELYQVLQDWKDKKIKTADTVIELKNEVLELLETDDYIVYGKTSKKFIISLLNKLNDLNKSAKSNDNTKPVEIDKLIINDLIQKIEYNLYYLLIINEHYHINLINKIQEIITSTYEDENEFVKTQYVLHKTCSYLISDLINNGFSRAFIRQYFDSNFWKTNPSNFTKRFHEFKTTFSYETKITFAVVFKLSSNTGIALKENIKNIYTESSEIITKYNIDNERALGFLQVNEREKLILIETLALDRYQAISNARKDVEIILDVFHLIKYSESQTISSTVLVLNTKNTKDVYTNKLQSRNDSSQSEPENYIELINKLVAIKDNPCVIDEVSDKLYSCIKHLRLANESNSPEQKFLNCWIGLENIFANYNIDSSTFRRIKTNLVNAHLVSYTKRNLHSFHKMLTKSPIRKQISHYNETDLCYLKSKETYDQIIGLEDKFPLIAFRGRYLKSMIFNDVGQKKKYINKHKKNLERHLTRMYRIRNEIVHDARTSYNIDNIYINLRYYLTFVLSKCVDFFSDCKPKPLLKNMISMDDFFSYQDSILETLALEDYSIEKSMNVPHSVDLFI